MDRADYARMLFNILYFQSKETIDNREEIIKEFLSKGVFRFPENKTDQILNHRIVELKAFALMPNHFHLKVQETVEGGTSYYLNRIENSFTRYFNVKNKRSGHLFEGPFKAVNVESNEQLLHLSAYIHKNPAELKSWRDKEDQYPWSSYQDYILENRWGEFLKPDIVFDQFKDAY